MKRLFILCLAALALPIGAGAQVFNHVALGVGAGTDGLSFELAAPLGRHVDVRAGYGTAIGLLSYTVKDISLPEHPGNPSSSSVATPLKVSLGMSDARLLFNIYPSAKGGFHFTFGAYMGAPRFARGAFSNLPSDYNTGGIEVDGYLVKATSGTLAAELCAPGLGGPSFAVKPYVGIGFGRAVSRNRVSFSFDLGAQYQGKPGLWAEGEGLTGRKEKVRLDGDDFEALDSIDEFGKYLSFWPTLNFHLFVKLF